MNVKEFYTEKNKYFQVITEGYHRCSCKLTSLSKKMLLY